MFVKFKRTIINLEYIVSVEFNSEDITVNMIDGTSFTTDITGEDELRRVLAEYNGARGYKND